MRSLFLRNIFTIAMAALLKLSPRAALAPALGELSPNCATPPSSRRPFSKKHVASGESPTKAVSPSEERRPKAVTLEEILADSVSLHYFKVRA